MNRVSPPKPTPEQIKANAVITWRDDRGEHTGRACWYPQMGGYVAKCVVELGSNGNCFEAWVWHDGDFPFADDDPRDENGPRQPLRMHHCRAEQFIQFGEEVKRFAADAARKATP